MDLLFEISQTSLSFINIDSNNFGVYMLLDWLDSVLRLFIYLLNKVIKFWYADIVVK